MSDELMDLADKARIELTLNTREQIINGLMKGGLPTNKGDQEFLIQALNGLDSTVIAKAKLKVEDQSSKNQHQTTKLIADILSRYTVKNTQLPRTDLPSLPNEVIINDLVDGEAHIGVQVFTYDEFVN